MQSHLHAARFGGTRSVGVHRPGLTHSVMLKRIPLTRLALIGVALAIAAPAQAQRQPERLPFELPFQRGDGQPSSQFDVPRRERAPQQDNVVPPSQVFRDLESKYKGEKINHRRQGEYYIVTWRAGDGRVLTLRVNVRTGREE